MADKTPRKRPTVVRARKNPETAAIREKPKAAPVREKPKPKAVMFASKRIVMTHPIERVQFLPGVPVECREDAWTIAQVNAGLMKKIL